jgi:ribosome-binding factor A
MPPHRQERVEEAIREALAEVFLFTFKDPRLPAVFNLTKVKVTPDLQQAKVYFTQMPDEDADVEETLVALDSGRGFLRSQVAQKVRLRYTPELVFYYDRGQRQQEKIEALLKQARASMPPPQTPETPDE